MRARATVATDPREGMAELEQQTAKLMTALTKAGQGNNPSSAQVAPVREAVGWVTLVVTPPVTQTPAMVEVGPRQTTTACSLPTEHGAGGNVTGSN